MKVVHYLAAAGYGGAERVAATLHQLALERGIESRVEVPPVLDLRVCLERDFGIWGGDEAGFARWLWAARRRLKLSPDAVVHAHLASPSFAGQVLVYARSYPLVATFHLLPERRFPADRLLRVPSPWLLAQLARRRPDSALVTVAERDLTRLKTLVGSERFTCVPNAPPLAPGHSAANSNPWPPGALRLLSVGRLSQQKGFDRMVRALSDRELCDAAWHWVIVGEGEERPALQDLIRKSGICEKVTLVGAEPAAPYFEQCELVLLPSRFEGMPLVLLEALSAGAPIVASDIGAHREKLLRAPASLLPRDDAAWPGWLAPLVLDGERRAALATAQAGIVPENARERCLQQYVALYERVSASHAS